MSSDDPIARGRGQRMVAGSYRSCGKMKNKMRLQVYMSVTCTRFYQPTCNKLILIYLVGKARKQ